MYSQHIPHEFVISPMFSSHRRGSGADVATGARGASSEVAAETPFGNPDEARENTLMILWDHYCR